MQISKLEKSKIANYDNRLTVIFRKEIKMNVKLIATVGFKILTAVVAGTAVFIGIGQAINSGKQNGPQPQPQPRKDGGNPFESNPTEARPEGAVEVKKSSADTIAAAIRGAGETCGKLFTFAQSLSSVVDAGAQLFNKGGNNGGYYQNGSVFVPVNNPRPFTSGSINWVPQGSYILQAVPNGNPTW